MLNLTDARAKPTIALFIVCGLPEFDGDHRITVVRLMVVVRNDMGSQVHKEWSRGREGSSVRVLCGERRGFLRALRSLESLG